LYIKNNSYTEIHLLVREGEVKLLKFNQYKALDCRVVGFMVLFALIFPVGVAVSQTSERARFFGGELIAQGNTQKQRKEEAIGLIKQGLQFDNQGRYQEALELYEKALVICKEIGDKALLGITLNNIGTVYNNLGQYQKALDYFQQSLVIRKHLGDKSGESATLNGIGGVYYSLGQYQNALDYYQQSLIIRKHLGDKSGEGAILSNIGLVYDSLGQYQKALDYYQQSLVISQQIGNKAGEGQTLSNIGAVYVNQGQYYRAEKPLFAAIEIWDSLRTKLSDDKKISLFARQTDTYKFLQLALIPQNKISLALEISERGRARAFIDLLTSKATNNNDTIGKLPTIADIKQIAQRQKSTLVEYSVLGDEKLYIWIVKPTGEIAFEQVDLKPLKTPLDKLVSNSRLSIGVRGRGIQVSQAPGANQKERLQQLHDILIKPIAKHLPKNPEERVVFVPHESLFLVPFPALIDENQKYLIEKHTILTAPAIQVLEFTEKNNPKPINYASLPQDEKLIVGNPIMPFVGVPPTQLPSLSGAESETRLISSLLNAKPLIGKEATKTAVMRRINSAKLIHFATHGLLDGFGERTPGAIALAPDSPPSPKQANEGLLRTSEIVSLKLQADLIVLSACDTGSGEISGDGVLGLSRALLTAGAKSLVVSLWQVDDKATSDLMVEFYQQLEKNPDKARALRQAILKIKEKHPGAANWAAFTIIGNPE
jgi:CHAT domain-containing protein/Tfp pilus assembly protein PilF